jgi:hypothetical protein
MVDGKTENPTNNKLTDTTRDNDVKGKCKFGYLVKMERKLQKLVWKCMAGFYEVK